MGCKKCAESKKKTRFQAKKEVMARYGDEGWEDDEYEEVIERRLDGYCIECSDSFHDSCGMVSRDEDCSCCDNTRDSLNAEAPHRMFSHCADCGCGLDSKTHKMDTSGSVGGVGSSNGALCDSCFVHLKKTGNFNNPVSLTQYGAEEPTVQEPDWIPQGDGRAIGQQDLAINLTPLHAETVGTPSPTFNEDITGQDGPSDTPTNEYMTLEAEFNKAFEAMGTFAPSHKDVNRAREDLLSKGYGTVIYDRYMVNQTGSSNKFYYTAVTEKDGRFYAMGSHGRIGVYTKPYNIYGKKESPMAHLGTMRSAFDLCRQKEKAKINKRGYVDYTLNMAEETLSEIEGPTAEATTGGLHAPSSFAMTWEDGTGQSSASIPPNEIAWAEEVKGAETKIFGIGLGKLGVIGIGIWGASYIFKRGMNSKKEDTASGSDTKNAEKGCGCAKTVRKSERVVKHSEYSVGQINPVEVEGQNDIRNAESIRLPTPHAGPQTAHRQNARRNLKMW